MKNPLYLGGLGFFPENPGFFPTLLFMPFFPRQTVFFKTQSQKLSEGCLVCRVRPGRMGVGRLLHDGGGERKPRAVHVRSHLLASRYEQVGVLSLHHNIVDFFRVFR